MRRAFTLIELLVVIAVVAILIGMLLPALAGARETSRAMRCRTNVRTIAQSLHAYAGEHREVFPHWSGWQVYAGDGFSNEDTPGPGWAELLEPYVDPVVSGRLDAFKCPTRMMDCIAVAYFLQSRYTSSLVGVHFRRSIRMNQVEFAAQFVLTGDATNPYLFARPYGSPHLVPNVDPDDAREPATLYEGESDRRPHKAGSMLGYLDGHVDAVRSYEAGKMTWHGKAMKSWEEMELPSNLP